MLNRLQIKDEQPDMEDRESSNTVGEVPVSDPLLSNVELPLHKMYYPLGFSVEIATNSHKVLAAAEESWGSFRKCFSEKPLELRIGVLDGDSRECPPGPVVRLQRHLYSIVADAQNSILCDLDKGFAFGWLSRAAVESRAYLRYFFLEGSVLHQLASLYATPLHAACVKMAGRGVLLCGDSGAGKSSLAFACARAGWTYISDDATYLVKNRADRLVVGNSHKIRFRESAVQLFPELQGESITPRAAGKPSIEMPTARMPEIVTADSSHIDYVVFLNRKQPDPPCLVSFSRISALQWFEQSLSTPNAARASQSAAIHNLLDVEVLEMRYSDLDWAVETLENLVVKGVWEDL